jgi:hypothetical protein
VAARPQLLATLFSGPAKVNPVIRALRDNAIGATALHSYMLTDSPHLFFMHFRANAWLIETVSTEGFTPSACGQFVDKLFPFTELTSFSSTTTRKKPPKKRKV